MIEIFNIFLSLVNFLFLTSLGIPFFLFFKNKLIFRNFFNLETIYINLLVVFNLIWICSIFNLDKKIFFYFLILTSFINIFIFFLNNKFKIKIDNFSIFIIFIFLFLSIIIAHDLLFSHDVKLYWFEKTLLFYNDLFVAQDKTIKPEYPHFGTFLWAFFWINSFFDLEYFGRLSYLFIYIASVGYITNMSNNNFYIKVIISLIIFSLTFNIKYFDGRQDVLYFSLNLIAPIFLFRIINIKKDLSLNLFYLFLTINLLLWIKTEGILYLLAYALTIAFYINNKKKYYFLFSLLFAFLIKIYFYKAHSLSFNPSVQMYDENTLSKLLEIDLLKRTFSIIYWYFISLFKNPILIISFLVFVLFSFTKVGFFKKYNYLIFILLILNAGIFFSFLPTKYDFPFALIGSLDRVIYQYSGIFLLQTILEVKKINVR